MSHTDSLLADASVWAAAVDEKDRFHESARKIATRVEISLAALDLTLYEIANAVGVKMGMPVKAREIADLVFERCRGKIVTVDPVLLQSICELTGEHSLTAYDAAYVAAARRHGMTLVSADIRDLVSKGLAVTPDAAL